MIFTKEIWTCIVGNFSGEYILTTMLLVSKEFHSICDQKLKQICLLENLHCGLLKGIPGSDSISTVGLELFRFIWKRKMRMQRAVAILTTGLTTVGPPVPKDQIQALIQTLQVEHLDLPLDLLLFMQTTSQISFLENYEGCGVDLHIQIPTAAESSEEFSIARCFQVGWLDEGTDSEATLYIDCSPKDDTFGHFWIYTRPVNQLDRWGQNLLRVIEGFAKHVELLLPSMSQLDYSQISDFFYDFDCEHHEEIEEDQAKELLKKKRRRLK